jgi:hypothetical protein
MSADNYSVLDQGCVYYVKLEHVQIYPRKMEIKTGLGLSQTRLQLNHHPTLQNLCIQVLVSVWHQMSLMRLQS